MQTTHVVSSAVAVHPVEQAAKIGCRVLLVSFDALGGSRENPGYL